MSNEAVITKKYRAQSKVEMLIEQMRVQDEQRIKAEHEAMIKIRKKIFKTAQSLFDAGFNGSLVDDIDNHKIKIFNEFISIEMNYSEVVYIFRVQEKKIFGIYQLRDVNVEMLMAYSYALERYPNNEELYDLVIEAYDEIAS